MNKYRFVTLNVRGLLDVKKRNKFLLWLKHQNSDIIFLQETYFKKENIDKINVCCKEHGFTAFHSLSDSSHSRGVSILVSEKIDHEVTEYKCDTTGRMILLSIKIGENCFTLINIYAPNVISQRIEFFNKLSKFIDDNKIEGDYDIICGGDFNCPLNDNDRVSKNRVKDKSRNTLHDLIQLQHLEDAWNIFMMKRCKVVLLDRSRAKFME